MSAIGPAIEAGSIAGGTLGTAVGGPAGTAVGAVVGGIIGGGIALGITIKILFNKFKQDAQQVKKQSIQKQDPKYYKEKLQELSDKYVAQIIKLDLTKQIKKESNKKDVAFFGATSCGKSSLINKLFHTKLGVGIGQTTQSADKAYQDDKIRIWDTVGQNSSFQIFTYESLKFFHQMDIIFITYRDTIRSIQNMVKVICLAIIRNYTVYFVRSQCDQWKSTHHKSIDEEIENDEKILKGYGIKDPKILKSSAIDIEQPFFKNQNEVILGIIKSASK